MRALFLGCVLLLGALLPAAQEPARDADPLRARLHALTREERGRLVKNLELLQRLPPRAKAKLLERARVLRERERVFGLSTEREPGTNPRDLALQEATKRWRTWLRERGREVRERLPRHVLQRLEQARPEARRRYFERLIEQQERLGSRVLARARERAELPPHEVRRLEGLPARERMRALRELYAGRDLRPH